jgi:hypothetical protein
MNEVFLMAKRIAKPSGVQFFNDNHYQSALAGQQNDSFRA